MSAINGIDELGGNAQLLAILADATLQQVIYAQLFPDDAQILVLPLNEKLDVRPATRSSLIWANWLSNSSERPSEK